MHRLTGSLVIAATALAATALAGCDILGAQVRQGLTSSGCANISGGACQEQVERVAGRHRGATSIELTCVVALCDRKGGSGTAVVTMPNGAKLNDTFSYAGDATPLPVPLCTGIAFDICRNLAQAQADGVAPSKRIVAVEVTCTALPCTTRKGTADVTVTLGDGSKEQGGTSWDGPLP